MTEDWQNGGFGLYIHWPFCQAKCPYCDFNSHVVAHVDQSAWAAAYVSEINRLGQETRGRVLQSVFFGGGTPSLMEAATVETILNAVRANWSLANDIEITLEANPTSVEATRFSGYRMAGVNRVSMGIQALNDTDLKKLGRLHTADEAMRAFEVARTAFDRVSFDLIYARQDQTLDAWDRELGQALALGIDHLSLYQLTIEDGTAFGDRYARGSLRGLPSDDRAADMYELTQERCEANGLGAYEVSNHAKIGSESVHNKIYWNYGDYVGIGPGAHGRLTLDGKRFATECPKAPGKWLNLVNDGKTGEIPREALDLNSQQTEYLLMGMRLLSGVGLNRLSLGQNENLLRNINALSADGLLDYKHDQLSATAIGRPVLNALLQELLRD